MQSAKAECRVCQRYRAQSKSPAKNCNNQRFFCYCDFDHLFFCRNDHQLEPCMIRHFFDMLGRNGRSKKLLISYHCQQLYVIRVNILLYDVFKIIPDKYAVTRLL